MAGGPASLMIVHDDRPHAISQQERHYLAKLEGRCDPRLDVILRRVHAKEHQMQLWTKDHLNTKLCHLKTQESNALIIVEIL